VAIAVVVSIVVSQRTPAPPQQIAQVLKAPETAAEPVAPPPAETRAPAPPVAQRKIAPAPAAQPPPPAPAAESVKELQKTETDNRVADQVQPAKPLAVPPAAAGAVRQFAAARVTAVFGLSYTVEADGFLIITPTAQGFLSVTANDSVISPSAVVNAGTRVRIAIPPGATSLIVAFSMTPGVSGAPVRRDETSGTVTDQDPPNGKILIQLFLTPATR